MKKGNILLNINADVVEGPKGLSIREIMYKETLANGNNIYQVVLENNIVIGEIECKKGNKGDKGEKGDTGKGILAIVKKQKIGLMNYFEIQYTDKTTWEFAIEDGENAYEVAVDNGFEGTEEEWLLSLIGRGLEFSWEGSRLGVRVDGETEYQYSDDLKGEKGDRGDIGPGNILSIGKVEKGEEPQVTIEGESPEQVLNFVLPKGDKGEIGEKGEQGEQGRKGNGIVRTQFIREDNERVYYKFIYDDGSEFQWSTWKGEAGISVTGAIAGDIVDTLDRTVETQEDWLSLENYRAINILDYSEMQGKVKTTNTYWENIVPKDLAGTDDSRFTMEWAYFDMNGNKYPLPSQKLIAGIKGGNHKPEKIILPYSSNQPIMQGAGNYKITIAFGGSIVRELIANNKNILCIVDLRFKSHVRDQYGNTIWSWNEIVNSSGFHTNNYQVGKAQKSVHNLLSKSKGTTDIRIAVGMQYNKMAMETGMLTSYQNIDDARDPNYIGFIIDSNENDLEIEIYKMEMWVLKNGNEEYLDLPPNKLMPNFIPYWEDSANSGGDFADIDKYFYLEQNLKRQIYLGKKTTRA
ncbi:hypothetical protein [Fusobacterium sp.]|uniref:hypothetical protein n=1 Tax=Fusobacterium sp. TaxID=68766 RepID=UPI0029016F95|nr:hypothetical protein [Fusobacterium sp.]MDU1912428.1 hypothetical protein [Fusobacterium sp.]